MSRKFLFLCLIVSFWAIYNYLQTPLALTDYRDHRYISSEVQTFNGYTLRHLEPYEGTFRIFSTEKYYWDKESDISPLDLLVGWGDMDNPAIYEKIEWSQSGRFGRWRYQGDLPLPIADLQRQVANMHMIAANKNIAKQLKRIKKNQRVFIRGYLVEVRNQQGWYWLSSLSRTDVGAGACELMLVNEINIIS